MRTTGLGLSAFLVAVGAILAWAVTASADGIDINQVGIILFVVGLVLGAITIAMGMMGRRTTIETVDQDSVVGRAPAVHEHREVVTDHNPPPAV